MVSQKMIFSVHRLVSVKMVIRWRQDPHTMKMLHGGLGMSVYFFGMEVLGNKKGKILKDKA